MAFTSILGLDHILGHSYPSRTSRKHKGKIQNFIQTRKKIAAKDAKKGKRAQPPSPATARQEGVVGENWRLGRRGVQEVDVA